MFIVYDKKNLVSDHITGCEVMKPVNVYNVRDDKNGYPHFLIYENGEWKYVKANRFAAQQEIVKI